MLLGQQNALLEPGVSRIQEKDLRQGTKYLQKCRDKIFKRKARTKVQERSTTNQRRPSSID